MDHAHFGQTLRQILGPDQVRPNAPLAPLTTFRVGGAADWLVEARSVEQLTAVLRASHAANVPVTVLGGGSNVVVSDDGVRGIVIRVLLTAISKAALGRVRAEAGVTINGLV